MYRHLQAPDRRRWPLYLLALAAWACHLRPLGGPPAPAVTDLILVTVDALRADRLGAYGYPRRTSPNLDRLAQRALRFEHAYAAAPHTSLALTSLMTGRHLWSALRLAPDAPPQPTVARRLREAGFVTAAFYPPAVFFTEGEALRAYADDRLGFERAVIDYSPAALQVQRAVQLLREQRGRRTFLWLHLFEPHEPYERYPTIDFGPTDSDRYDGEVAVVDAALGQLIAFLDRERPGAALVVTADHGEAFGEHGDRYHGTSLYDEQVRVPLLIRAPGAPPRRVAEPVSLVALGPLLLELARGGAPRALGAGAPAAPVFAELDTTRMVVAGQAKLICELSWDACRLFDRAQDPGEGTDRAGHAAPEQRRIRALLDGWVDAQIRAAPRPAALSPEAWLALGRLRLGDSRAATAAPLLLDGAVPVALRAEAARRFAGLPPLPAVRAAVAQALRDPARPVAGWAASAAFSLPGARARARDLLRDQGLDGELRTALALALNDEASVPLLTAALGSCRELAQCRRLIQSLGQARDLRAIPALLARLPGVELRREVVEALGAIGAVSTWPTLATRLLQDEYAPVRVAAARALGRLGARQALAALERAARSDTEPPVVAAAREEIARLRAGAEPGL